MAFFARDAFICMCRKEECDMCNKKYFEPFTNADRIRAMTDEELAEWLNEVNACSCSYAMGKSPCYGKDCPCWLDWLKQECEA